MLLLLQHCFFFIYLLFTSLDAVVIYENGVSSNENFYLQSSGTPDCEYFPSVNNLQQLLDSMYGFFHVMSGDTDGSVSFDECKSNAGSNWDVDSFSNIERPAGCFYFTNGKYYYNTAVSSISCTSLYPCVKKKVVEVTKDTLLPYGALFSPLFYEDNSAVTGDSQVTFEECQAYALATAGLTFFRKINLSWRPAGCIIINTLQVYYNEYWDSTILCNQGDQGHVACVKKTTTHGFSFNAPVTIVQVASGEPDLSVNENECNDYADDIGKYYGGALSFSMYAGGCIDIGSVIYYNTYFYTPIVECKSGTAVCLQKESAFQSISVECSAQKQCLCQKSQVDTIVKYTYGRLTNDLLQPFNVQVEGSYQKYATKNSYALNSFGTCMIGNSGDIRYYYTEDECSYIGGTFDSTTNNDITLHFDAVDASVTQQEDNPTATKNRTFYIDIYGTDSADADVLETYQRSAFRQFIGKETSLSDRNKALADCTVKCKANDDCAYISLKSSNECMMYRKCEQTTNDVEVEFYYSTVGKPDLSVIENECSTMANENNYIYIVIDNPLSPAGCFRMENKIYYNNADSGLECSATKECIQKRYKELQTVDTYRKVGVHATKASSSGVTQKGYFHDAGTEFFLCKNYQEGIRLHNFFFNLGNTNILMAGSTLNHVHASTLWPSQSYVHHDNDYWISTHPTKKFLRYDVETESYVAYLKSETSDAPGIRFGYLVTSQEQCTYEFTQQDCIDFSSSGVYAFGNMELENTLQYYLVTEFDSECAMGSVSEEQCNEYRLANNYIGSTVFTNTRPSGCSVVIDNSGNDITEVYYNTFEGTLAQSGNLPYMDGSLVTHGLCFGNPNRFNPKGCFVDASNNVNFNGGDAYSSCSVDKQCVCSYGVPVFNIEGGLKEASNERLCSEVCSSQDGCEYLQIHDGVCYGLSSCDTTNDYLWSMQHDWAECNFHETSGKLITDLNLQSDLNNCANGCKVNGFSNEYVYVKKASIASFESETIEATETCEQTFQADSARNCSYLTSDSLEVGFTYNALTGDCFAGRCNGTYYTTFKLVTSGGSTTEVNAADCEAYANALGLTFRNYNSGSEPRGCYRRFYSGDNSIRYNPCTNWYCKGCSNTFKCVRYGGYRWDKQKTCHCLSDSCPSAVLHNNFTKNEWNQIYSRSVITSATSTSKVYKVEPSTNSFPLFPYKGFWDCDAIRYTNVTSKNACGEKAQLLHHFVFSYNAVKGICIVYTHYVEDTHDLLLRSAENAEWCFKGNNLRGHDAFNLQYGTCSNDVSLTDIVVTRNCKMSLTDALNSSQCLSWKNIESTMEFEKLTLGEVFYHNVAEANEVCMQESQCNIIVHDQQYSKSGRYALFANVKNVSGNQSVVGEYAEKGLCTLNHILFELKDTGETGKGMFSFLNSGAPATSPDLSYVSVEECEGFASTYGFTYSTQSNTQNPNGCFIESSNVFFNMNGDVDCAVNPNARCLKKNLKPSLHFLTLEECKSYAELHESVTWADIIRSDFVNPNGCYIQNNNVVYYGVNGGSRCDNGFSKCIQKVNSKALEIDSTGLGTTYKGFDPYHCTPSQTVRSQLQLSSFDIFSCTEGDVEWTGFAEVSSGAPDLSVSESECQEYANSIGAVSYIQVELSNRPSGCFKWTTFSFVYMYYNLDQNTNACSTTRKCIQKSHSTTGTLTECEDACTNDDTCTTVLYQYDTKTCQYGIGLYKEGTAIVCSYDRDKDNFLSLVPEQTCEATFTPHNDPDFDQFQSYMLGNVEYNVGGSTCVGCPQGQYPTASYGYECDENVRRYMFCADGSSTDCRYGTENKLTLHECKLQCDQSSTCEVLSFTTTTNFELGSCYLFTSQQVSLPEENTKSISCNKVQLTFECLPCAVGKYKRGSGQVGCSNCGIGTYQDETGQASCKACAANSFQDQTGRTSCKPIDQYEISFSIVDRVLNENSMLSEFVMHFTEQTEADCVRQIGLQQLRIMLYDSESKQCSGFYSMDAYTTQLANNIIQDIVTYDALTSCVDCTSVAHVIKASKKVCVASLLVGTASGPLQDNSVSDVPSQKEGGTELCDGCAEFTIAIPGTDECSACGAGSYYTAVPSPRCKFCEPGFYRNTEKTLGPNDPYTVSPYIDFDVYPLTWPVVDANTYRCHPCPPGYYAEDEQTVSCSPCPTGKYSDSWMTVTCKDCPIGQYMATTGHVKYISNDIECEECQVGKYQSEQGEDACNACDYGEYADEIGLAGCKTCAAGRFSAVTGSLKNECSGSETSTSGLCCQDCAAGKYSNSVMQGIYSTGSNVWPPSSCLNCPRGRVNGDLGQSECKICSEGKYMYYEGQTRNNLGQNNQCNDCPLGYIAPLESWQCFTCNNGFYTTEYGQGACKSCRRGRFSDTTLATFRFCKVCSVGQYQDEYGATNCKMCVSGRFQNTNGFISTVYPHNDVLSHIECKPCAVGKYFNKENYEFDLTQTYDLTRYPDVLPLYSTYMEKQTGFCAGHHFDQYCEFRSDSTAPYEDGWGAVYSNGDTVYQAFRTPAYVSCAFCERGQYNDELGQEGCKNCPIGKHGPWGKATKSSHCIDCPSGKYSTAEGNSACYNNNHVTLTGSNVYQPQSDCFSGNSNSVTCVTEQDSSTQGNWDDMVRLDGCIPSGTSGFGTGSLRIGWKELEDSYNNNYGTFRRLYGGACKSSRIICDHVVGNVEGITTGFSNTQCLCLTPFSNQNGVRYYDSDTDTYTDDTGSISSTTIGMVRRDATYSWFPVAENDAQACATKCQTLWQCQQTTQNQELKAAEPISTSNGVYLRL